MKFTSMEHQKRFFEIKKQMPSNLNGNNKLLSIAYIMSSSNELKNKIQPYIQWGKGFDYEKMVKEVSFSKAELILVKASVTFFDNGVILQFAEVFTELESQEREIVFNAADIRYSKKDIYEQTDGNLYIK
ncbi:hypothetical protein CEQ21_07655 (plasmid) [Niallia circulans]|uniref:Uncharacterized protein n=1 Tax=Niallia circulans TaxID=1397 RepID=A0A553SQF8_NIACI|nr:hypothetical protein [Niallia circulans]TRZ39235.1 hypothetical protein CEQ21_07655 [Niallia circulans]